jgi:pyrimidine-nucleoside phosphorylase
MSRPLGRAVGNALEADESIRVLRNEGPDRIREICILLGTDMLHFAEPSLSDEDARSRLEQAFDSGAAARKFEELIEFQGGNPRVVADPSLLPQPRQRIPALSLRGGYVRSISTEKMGFLSIDIGCGRKKREDEIDPAAGFLVEKNVGDRVEPGETLAWLCLGDQEPPRPNMERELAALFHVGDTKVEPPPLAIEKL